MLRRSLRVLVLVLPLAPACVCHRATSDGGSPTTTSTTTASPSADAPETLAWDLHLQHHVLEAYGNTVPLPVSQEFEEVIPQAMPMLEKAASERGADHVRLRVERDVPYGQVTRLMQAGIGVRIAFWEVISVGVDGALHSVKVKTPGGMPRGMCWARAWIGPDQRTLVGAHGKIENIPDGGAEVYGTLVWPQNDHVAWEKIADVVHRLDPNCESGPFRIYAQPSGAWGPVFDLSLGFTQLPNPPHVHELQLQVPSLGPMDSTQEVIK